MKSTLFFILITSPLFVSCVPKANSPCGFNSNVYGERISLEKKKIHFHVDADVSLEYDEVILSAIKEWNDVFEENVISIDLKRVPISLPEKDNLNIIYFMKSWEPARSSEQGRASLYWNGKEIKEVDIRINILSFKYSTSGTSEIDKVDLKTLLIHELGHALGLKHTDKGGSLMDYNLPMSTIREIAQIDKENISCEYKLKTKTALNNEK